jgi:hypothetical protein
VAIAVAVVLIVALVVALLTLGGDEGEKAATTSTTTTTTRPATTTSTTTSTTTTSPPETTTTVPSCTVPGGGTGPGDLPANGGRTQLQDVRVLPPDSPGAPPGVATCAEHVVFFFEPLESAVANPAVTAEYRDGPLRLSPSDLPVTVAGNVFLVVRFEPSQNHTDAGSGPIAPVRVAGPAGDVVREVVLLEDFEGVVQYAIGLDRKVPFTLNTAVTGSSVWISFGS